MTTDPTLREPTSLGWLGFGEAARAYHATLAVVRPDLEILAWDVKLLDPATAPAMRAAMAEHGVTEADGPAALGAADWVLSAVTADQSLIAAQSALQGLAGTMFIDLNSVSPDRKRQTAAAVIGAGGRYLDMAVMTPVHPNGHRSRVLIAGPEAEALARVLARMEFTAKVAGDTVGAATAIKMVRSVFVKGLEAITTEALLAAEASGCFDAIRDSLAASYPGLGWPDHAAYVLERTLRHGARRAAEMEESGATLDALGLVGDLPRAIAEVQRRQGRAGAGSADLPGDIPSALAARRASDG